MLDTMPSTSNLTEDREWRRLSSEQGTSVGVNGWLSPAGRFYPCEFRQHDRFASILTRNYYNSHEGTRRLESERWIRVSNGIFRWLPGHKPTRPQYEFACELLNQPLSPDVKKRVKFSIRLMEMMLHIDR